MKLPDNQISLRHIRPNISIKSGRQRAKGQRSVWPQLIWRFSSALHKLNECPPTLNFGTLWNSLVVSQPNCHTNETLPVTAPIMGVDKALPTKICKTNMSPPTYTLTHVWHMYAFVFFLAGRFGCHLWPVCNFKSWLSCVTWVLVWHHELLRMTESFEWVLFIQSKHVFLLGISSLWSVAAPLSARSAHPCMIWMEISMDGLHQPPRVWC